MRRIIHVTKMQRVGDLTGQVKCAVIYLCKERVTTRLIVAIVVDGNQSPFIIHPDQRKGCVLPDSIMLINRVHSNKVARIGHLHKDTVVLYCQSIAICSATGRRDTTRAYVSAIFSVQPYETRPFVKMCCQGIAHSTNDGVVSHRIAEISLTETCTNVHFFASNLGLAIYA